MRSNWIRVLVLVLGVSVLARPAAAQGQESRLKLPTIALATAAVADWATTYHVLKHYQLREANPLLRRFARQPGKLVSIGSAMDVGMVAAWNYSVGREHPKLAAAGLWTMTAFRAYLALHNMRNVQRSARR